MTEDQPKPARRTEPTRRLTDRADPAPYHSGPSVLTPEAIASLSAANAERIAKAREQALRPLWAA